MIFPQLPRRIVYKTPLHRPDDKTIMIRQQLEREAQSADSIQTPLRVVTSRLDYRALTDAETPLRVLVVQRESIRFQDDPWGYIQFGSICAGLCVWAWFWHGLH